MITVYLNSIDLVQAFYGLNRRFNSLVLQSSRHFIIPNETSKESLIKSLSSVENIIEKIYFDVKLLSQVFLCTYSFSNLHSVLLRCSTSASVELNVKCYSPLAAIFSCMNVLRLCNIYSEHDDDYDEGDYEERTRNERVS